MRERNKGTFEKMMYVNVCEVECVSVRARANAQIKLLEPFCDFGIGSIPIATHPLLMESNDQ